MKGNMNEANRDQQDTRERQVKLRTLAPEHDKDQHGIYVRHLNQAVQEKKNRNIALTGRYGAGKSSVLDDFEEQHKQSTVRISINTLGPAEAEEDLTNRIQKELVKQLVYRLKPGQIRRSRFARPKPLTRLRAFLQALGVSSVGLGFLWLFGVHPPTHWPGAEADTVVQVLLGTLFFALVLITVWAVRWIIGDRIVSEVTTAGTKIALGEEPTTYFDNFLDEIVAFFDAIEPKYVIFEDLDRFDDPQIFDSLRELNTLINTSANWEGKDEPLRFIYAIKDSLFEQLGEEAELKAGESRNKNPQGDLEKNTEPQVDLAAAAVRRANRTKFFEMVIPIVPFISHRNARDHLLEALESLGFPKDYVSRPLLDLTARHTTDMRLMINICNEFAVFAAHLLWTNNRAPGMTADHLFALVVYKNFHLADFEAISQRASSLDQLERYHRDEIGFLIASLQDQRRAQMRTEERREQKEETAIELGSRLRSLKDVLSDTNSPRTSWVTVEDETNTFDAVVDTVEFWERVAKVKSLSIITRQGKTPVEVTAEPISQLFPEVVQSEIWLDPNPAELARLLQHYDSEIARLRGADFADLIRYKSVHKGRPTFSQRVTEVLKSELARDLVRRGFITRNYAEYSAIFYGNFIGVDVAFFYNHSVQQNEMYVHYEFDSDNSVNNLLEQVPADFTSSVSALNIQVVSYLLNQRAQDAKKLVTFLATHHSTEVDTFLVAFLNMPTAPRELLIQQLTKHPWRDVFEFVAGHPHMPDEETRLKLLDAALKSMSRPDFYDIGESTREFLITYYPKLTAIYESQNPTQTDRIFAILEEVALLFADLGSLSEPLRKRAVAAHMYELSAHNLKLALEIEDDPTLDEIRQNPDVWDFCRTRIAGYIIVIQADDSIQYSVLTEDVLVEIINEEHDSWEGDQLSDIVNSSAPSAALHDIEEIPELTWPMIVNAGLMVRTVANVAIYSEVHGVDKVLSNFLAADGAALTTLQNVEDVDAEARETLAIHLLNASSHLAAQLRVQLASQLQIEADLPLDEITPSPDQLLARALEAKILPDERETFAHFAQGGWAAVSDAFVVSENVVEYMDPTLVEGFAADFLESERIPDELRRVVVEDISSYLPDDDSRALRAAGSFARAHRIWLSLDDVRRIARFSRDPEVVLPQLVRAKDITTAELADVLALLGDPYHKLVNGPGGEFSLPAGSSNETLFKRLEAEGKVRIVPKSIGRGRKVEVLK